MVVGAVVWWCHEQSSWPFSTDVDPPLAQGCLWWASAQAAGRSQCSSAQVRCRSPSAIRW